MIKHLSPLVCFLLTSFASIAQSKIEYLELTSVQNSGDSSFSLSFVVSVTDYNTADSLLLSIADNEGNAIYQSGNTLSGWIGLSSYRIEGSNLYLTIDAATYAGSAGVEAEAYTVANGSRQPGKTYKRNLNTISTTE